METSFIHTQILVHLHVNKINFHMKGFAPGVALKQRRKATRKSPIHLLNNIEGWAHPFLTACVLNGNFSLPSEVFTKLFSFVATIQPLLSFGKFTISVGRSLPTHCNDSQNFHEIL